jgi:mannosyltransferase OCH1-like enzyme
MNIWVYWENKETKRTPDHIKKCLETIEKHSGNANLVVLDETSKEVKDIISYDFPDVELALKADVIRANLLYKFGGICVDADVIVLKDLSKLLDMLIDGKTFVGFEDDPFHARLGIMAGSPNSQITKLWVRMQVERLKQPWSLHWTALGCDLLWKATKAYPEEYVGVDMKLFYPIPWTKSETFFTELDPYLYGEDLYGVQLFGKMTFKRLVATNLNELLNSDMLISKFFRKAFE